MSHSYLIYDVFTRTRLTGNPLAVVLDADDLSDKDMQAIAREFNFSESVFVLRPSAPSATACIRIFTPHYEMPFAGHPTVGTAVALSELQKKTTPSSIVLEEKIGPVRCTVSPGRIGFAEFELPQLPAEQSATLNTEQIASALGLASDDIGFENHTPGLWSAGNPFLLVPVRGLEVAGRIQLDGQRWHNLGLRKPNGSDVCPYIYCRETTQPDHQFHARMLVPTGGGYEDPATGSAAASFAGALNRFEQFGDGSHRVRIEQGLEMGRSSSIQLELDIQTGAISRARIGGHAVRVAEGKLLV